MISTPDIDTDTLGRTLHEVGLAAWFGGALMGAAALNPASGEVADPGDRLRVANAAWGRWMPVAALSIGAHLLGAARVTADNKGRLLAQRGVGTNAAIKGGLTAAAVAATVGSGIYGRKAMRIEAEVREAAGDDDGLQVDDATTPERRTSDELADAQRKLKLLQWAIPALTGAMLVMNARLGEQQRPIEVLGGILDRVVPGR